MNVFNEEPAQRPVAKKDSWPIRLAMKYGAKSQEQASTIVIVISVLLLIATAIIYKNLFFSSPNNSTADINSIPPEIRAELEAAGVDLYDL